MTETFITTIIGGLTIPAIAFAFKLALDRWIIGRSKEFTVELENGKIETVTVDASANDVQVAATIHSGIALERDVAAALEKISQNTDTVSARSGKRVDFLIQVPGKIIAIECKTSVDQISEASIEKYLEAEGGSSKLLLVTRKPAPRRVLERTREFIESGKLLYIEIRPGDDVFEKMSSVISSELPTKRRDTSA